MLQIARLVCCLFLRICLKTSKTSPISNNCRHVYYYDKILSQLEQLFDYGVIFLFLFVFQVIALVFNVEFISKTRIKSKMQCSMRMERPFVLSYNTLSMNEEVTWVTLTHGFTQKCVFTQNVCLHAPLEWFC